MNLDMFRAPGDPEPAPPAIGDIILTATLAKVVVAVRPVESRVWHHRWRLETKRIRSGRRSDPEVMAEVGRLESAGGVVRETVKYERGETAVAFARAQGYAVDAG